MVSVQVAASQIFNSHMWIVATLLMSTDLEDNSKGRLIFQRLFSWGKISSFLDLGIKYKHNFLNKKTQRYASVQFSRSIMSDSLQLHGLQQPGFLVHHHLPEFAQTHVHWVSDTIRPSHPLFLPALNFSQHQGLSQWVSFSNQVAKVLELQLQPQSFQWIFKVDFPHYEQ